MWIDSPSRGMWRTGPGTNENRIESDRIALYSDDGYSMLETNVGSGWFKVDEDFL